MSERERPYCRTCKGIMDRKGWECRDCTNIANERKAIWVNNRVKAGRCPRCSTGKVIPGTSYCEKCKEKLIASNKLRERKKYPSKYTAADLKRVQAKRAQWAAENRCRGCGSDEKLPNSKHCEQCKEKLRVRQARWREKQ